MDPNRTDSEGSNKVGLDDGLTIQMMTDINFVRYPIELGQVCKFDVTKVETTSYFVKYTMQDGNWTKVWECRICGKAVGHQYTLVRHLATHTDERTFQCNTCGKAFRKMAGLSQHHRAIHSADNSHICEVCQKTFKCHSSLVTHRKIHTGLKNHRCHICEKTFHQKGNLVNHMFTHTNERPYKCDICSKGFNQRSNLRCHKVKAHQCADKQMLVPVTADENKENVPDLTGLENDNETVSVKPLGTNVQIKIPLVATVMQQCGQDGNMSMAVESPGPNSDDGMVDNNVYVTTTLENVGEVSIVPNFDDSEFNNIPQDEANNIQGAQIQFVNDCGEILHEENGEITFFENDHQNNEEVNNVIGFQNDDEELLDQILNGDSLNISCDSRGHPIYEVLNKSDTITIYSAESNGETADVLYQDVNMVENFVIA